MNYLTLESEFSQYSHEMQHDMQVPFCSMPSHETFMDASQQESQCNPEFYHQYYQSQDSHMVSKLEPHFDLSEYESSQLHPQITPFQFNSDPQHYTLPHVGMSQSPTSRRRVQSFTRRRSGNSKVWGKLTFVNRPDLLGDFNQWSSQERQENRRIVAFHKVVHGDVIQLDCFPVAAQDYKENMITISCIRWVPGPPHEIQHKHAGKCVFTSVDIIILLERLADKTFEVQEKNRIRRNLEGYHPETVKKEGHTNLFFNQVMSYIHPKTRNIEKDIKVFLWADIVRALRKVFQKYSSDGGIPLGRPNSEPALPSCGFTGSQPSSSESLATQSSFTESDYSQQVMGLQHSFLELSQKYTHQMSIVPSSITNMIFGQDESGDSSSISSQSQVSQLGVPVEFRHIVSRSSSPSQQALDRYLHGIPRDMHFEI